MARVKICGLGRERDVRVAAEAGADAVGFITDVPVETPREVPPAEAAALAESAPPFVTTVAVTMPDTVADAVRLVDQVRPDAVQVHADFTPDQVRDLGDRTDVDVVVAIDADEAERARRLGGVADALLVDSLTEAGAGGSGETHDWDATRALVRDQSTPVVLAGGLTPENVTEAVETVAPMGVDVASGVEKPGDGAEKDHTAIRTFVRAAGRGLRATAPEGEP
ncbi:MAG: phosphoribosylanthranilate isomerase [Halolamina sp.]